MKYPSRPYVHKCYLLLTSLGFPEVHANDALLANQDVERGEVGARDLQSPHGPEALQGPERPHKHRMQNMISGIPLLLGLQTIPVGSYHTRVLVYPTLWFWDPNPKIR